jgi:hypothetical protein
LTQLLEVVEVLGDLFAALASAAFTFAKRMPVNGLYT